MNPQKKTVKCGICNETGTKVEKQNPTPTLPNEILNEIVGYMDIETMGRFSQCSKVCQSLTQPILTKIKKNFDIDVSLDEIKVGTVLVYKMQSIYNRGFVSHRFYQVKNITPQKNLRLIPLMREILARETSRDPTSIGNILKCTVSPKRLNNGDFMNAIVGVEKPTRLSKKFDKYEKNNRTWYHDYFLYDPSKEYKDIYKDIYHPHM